MTYTFTVEIPDLPLWAWISSGVGVWYLFSYIVVRIIPDAWFPSGHEDLAPSTYKCGLWLCSPAFFPLIGSLVAIIGAFNFVTKVMFGGCSQGEKPK